MNCIEVNELIQRYMDGNLSDKEQDDMNKHLEICRECQSFYERLYNVHLGLASLPKVNLPYSLVDTILPKLDQLDSKAIEEDQDHEKAKKRKTVGLPKRWQILSAVAASVLVILMINQWFTTSTPEMLMETASTQSSNENAGDTIESDAKIMMSVAENSSEEIEKKTREMKAFADGDVEVAESGTMHMLVTSPVPEFTLLQVNTPIWSPNAQYVAYNLGTSLEIFNSDGEMIYQLAVEENEQLMDVEWSSDQRLQYRILAADKEEVWQFDVSTGDKKLLQ